MAGIGNSSHLTQVEEFVEELPGTHKEEEDCMEKLDMDEDEPPYLTGKPRFDVVLGQSHVEGPCLLNVSKRMSRLLPRTETTTLIQCKNKIWNVSYRGHYTYPRFEGRGWRSFVKENGLRVRDACVFELMKCSEDEIKFKVQILRNDLPPELVSYLSSKVGESDENPIKIT